MHIHIAELASGLGKNLPFSFTTAAAKIDATADDYDFEGPIEVARAQSRIRARVTASKA